jgi:Tfp pilus assembly protein PilV
MRLSIRSSRRAREVESGLTGAKRPGIALVEVIVAMVLLAIAVSSLAGLVLSVSHQGIRTSGDAYKNGALIEEVNRLEGIPYNTIAVGTSSVTVSTLPYAHTRTVTVTEPQANVVKNIKVVIRPTNPLFKADSVTFVRTRAATPRVLCTDCPQN